MKKQLALFLSLCLVFSTVLPAYAYEREYIAGSIVILYSITGDNISVTNGTPVRLTRPQIRDNLELRAGSIVSTGTETSVILDLGGRRSHVNIHEYSIVRIAELGTRRLTVSVTNGDIAVHTFEHAEAQSVEVRIGASGVTVRGTLFTIGRISTDIVAVTMLSGYGTVHGVGETYEAMSLEAGQTMWVQDEIHEFDSDEYAISYRILSHDLEDMSLFTLLTVEANQEYLIDEGVFTVEALDGLAELIEVRTAELEAAREYERAAQQQILEQEQLTIPEVSVPATIVADDTLPVPPAPVPVPDISYSQPQSPPSSDITTPSPAALVATVPLVLPDSSSTEVVMHELLAIADIHSRWLNHNRVNFSYFPAYWINHLSIPQKPYYAVLCTNITRQQTNISAGQTRL